MASYLSSSLRQQTPKPTTLPYPSPEDHWPFFIRRTLSHSPARGRFAGNMETNKKPTILSPQQQVVLNRLLPVAKVATNGCRDDLPIQPRTSTLIVGPSGNGKSYIAVELGKRLGLPVLRINVSSWVVLSARNEPWTFSSIVQWVYSLQGGGGILVLDEADKLQGTGDWVSCIRHEAHDLLDFVIPLAARMPAAPTDDAWGIPDPPMFVERALLEKQLRERVFILACGAWQSAWRGNSRKLGFSQDESPVEPPSCEQILQSIEPELRQRFRHEVCWLPPMTRSDYHAVSLGIANRISNPRARKVWNRLAGEAIEHAVAAGLGMRIFEEMMLSVLIDTPDLAEPVVENFKQPEIW